MNGMKEAIQKIETAEADVELRVTRRMEIGSAIQQGDVYVHRLPDNWKRGKLVAKGEVQIAVGQNVGARHVAIGNVEVYAGVALPPDVTAPMGIEAREICGPVIVAETAWALQHPEHAHHRMPAGVYGVTYQYDPRTMRRVAD